MQNTVQQLQSPGDACLNEIICSGRIQQGEFSKVPRKDEAECDLMKEILAIEAGCIPRNVASILLRDQNLPGLDQNNELVGQKPTLLTEEALTRLQKRIIAEAENNLRHYRDIKQARENTIPATKSQCGCDDEQCAHEINAWLRAFQTNKGHKKTQIEQAQNQPRHAPPPPSPRTVAPPAAQAWQKFGI